MNRVTQFPCLFGIFFSGMGAPVFHAGLGNKYTYLGAFLSYLGLIFPLDTMVVKW